MTEAGREVTRAGNTKTALPGATDYIGGLEGRSDGITTGGVLCLCVNEADFVGRCSSRSVCYLGVLTSPQPQAALSSAGIVFQASALMWARIASPVVTLIAPLMR